MPHPHQRLTYATSLLEWPCRGHCNRPESGCVLTWPCPMGRALAVVVADPAVQITMQADKGVGSECAADRQLFVHLFGCAVQGLVSGLSGDRLSKLHTYMGVLVGSPWGTQHCCVILWCASWLLLLVLESRDVLAAQKHISPGSAHHSVHCCWWRGDDKMIDDCWVCRGQTKCRVQHVMPGPR